MPTGGISRPGRGAFLGDAETPSAFREALETMKLDFIKNTKRNVVAGAISRGLALLLPFLNRSLFLWLMGPKYLGLNGLFTSILGMLSLAELGFGAAVVCSMYKPIADDDRELVCAYLNFYRRVYRWVGSAIFVIGLCLLPFLRKLVHGDLPPDVDLHILYLLHLVNTSASYFLFAYRSAVINAHQRNYELTNMNTVLSLLQYLSVFLILILTRNYYLYVITVVIFTGIRNVWVMRVAKRLFPYIEPRGELEAERRRRVIADVKSIFMHKIGAVISYSIDNVVLSAFLGLVAVASYGNYYYVYTAVAGIPAVVYSTMAGGFGNRIHTESREENFRLFMRVSRLVGIIIIWCAAMMMALYQPFIAIWTRHNPDLVQHRLTAILMVAYFVVNQSRQVLLTYKAAAAIWSADRWKPVVSGVVKLAFCLFFIHVLSGEYKLDGVILSSIIGYLFIQIPWESHVMFTQFFDRDQAKVYWRHQALSVLIAAGIAAATWAVIQLIPMDKAVGLAVKGIAAAAFSGGLVVLFFRRDLREAAAKLLSRRRAAENGAH